MCPWDCAARARSGGKFVEKTEGEETFCPAVRQRCRRCVLKAIPAMKRKKVSEPTKMLPGRLQRNASTAQLREGELVLVQNDNTNVYFVCSVHSFSSDSQSPQFDRSVRLSIVIDSEEEAVVMDSPMPRTPYPPPPLTPITTPKPSPFSFKEFTSALKDTANTPVKPQRNSLASIPSTAKRQPPDLTKMKHVQVDNNLNLLIPSQQLNIPAASSVSLEVPIGVDFTPATRRRIQSWFVGMILSEGCEVSNILGSNGFTCTVRRTVPASATYCRVVPDTRLVFEPKPPQQQPRPQENSMLPNDPFMYGGLVLRGPSGTGKRFTVESFVQSHVNVDFIQASLRDEGEVAAALDCVAKQQQQQEKRCVLALLDGETNQAFASKTNNRKLAHLLDSSSSLLVFLLINNNNDNASIPPYLTRPGRLEREIIFTLPNAEQRERFMLDLQCNNVAAEFARDYCVGYSQRDLLQLLSRTKNNSDCTLDALHDAQQASGKQQRIARIDSNHLAVQQVGGQLEAKKALAMAVEWPFTRKEELRRFGLDVLFRGILLYGPAGCAKTTMVREVARRNAGNASFYALSGADVYSSGFGDAEAKVRFVFAQARATAPSILFFDEIDSLVGNRGLGASGGGDSVQSRVLSTFLNEMDGVDTSLGDTVVVIGATNCPQNLDRALLRPGRFDRVIFVGPPSPESVLEIELERMQLCTVPSIATLAREAEHMSGADIAGACRLAAVQAVSAGRAEPTEADIVSALRLATRSCKPEVLETFMRWSVGDN